MYIYLYVSKTPVKNSYRRTNSLVLFVNSCRILMSLAKRSARRRRCAGQIDLRVVVIQTHLGELEQVVAVVRQNGEAKDCIGL